MRQGGFGALAQAISPSRAMHACADVYSQGGVAARACAWCLAYVHTAYRELGLVRVGVGVGVGVKG